MLKIKKIILIILFISPLTLGWHRYILTESLSYSLTIFLFSSLLPIFFNKKINYILVSVLLIIGFYIRYDFIFFIIPIGLLFLLSSDIKLFFLNSIKIAIISILFVSPYLYRNYKVGLDFVPPTQIGLHLDDGPKTPYGYVDWISTWSFTNYMYANALYPTDYGNYKNIIIDDKAYFSSSQKKIVKENIKKLENYTNKPMPLEIDESFKKIAEYNKKNFFSYVYFVLPIKRFFSLWLNPVTSLGLPGSFSDSSINYEYFSKLDIVEKINFIKERFIAIFLKLFSFLYRFIILSSFVFIIYKTYKKNIKEIKPILYFVGSYFLIKNLFLMFTIYTATRHIVSSAILIELLIILYFYRIKKI